MEIQEMSKLYAFGCSYTNFKYPTYFDFLSPYFNESFNFGKPGCGNRAIFNTVVNHIDEIKKNDVVIVQWSSLLREDRIFYNNKWDAGGIITNTMNYNEEWIKKYFNPVQQATELYSYIKTLFPLLKTKTDNFLWCHMFEPWVSNFMGEPSTIDDVLLQKYDNLNNTKLLEKIRDISERSSEYIGGIENYLMSNNLRGEMMYNFDLSLNDVVFDDHPTPRLHYKVSTYIKKNIKLDIINNFELDMRLNENSLMWDKYVLDPIKITETERIFIKNHQRNIEYATDNVITWPKNIKYE
jgi:hypothetical protein